MTTESIILAIFFLTFIIGFVVALFAFPEWMGISQSSSGDDKPDPDPGEK